MSICSQTKGSPPWINIIPLQQATIAGLKILICSFPAVWGPSSLSIQPPLLPRALLLVVCRGRLLPPCLKPWAYASFWVTWSTTSTPGLSITGHTVLAAPGEGGRFIQGPSASISLSSRLEPASWSLAPSLFQDGVAPTLQTLYTWSIVTA